MKAFWITVAVCLGLLGTGQAAESLQVDPREVLPPLPPAARVEAHADPADASRTLYVASAEDGSVLGYAVPGRTARGYKGEVELLVGLTPDRHIVSYRALKNNETPKVGGQLATTNYIQRFIGLLASPALRVKQDGGTVEAMTGATVSSRAVCLAIADARDSVDRLEGRPLVPRAYIPQPLPSDAEGVILFDLEDDQTYRKVLPGAVAFTRVPVKDSPFAAVVGRYDNGSLTGFAVVGTGKATGPNGPITLHVLMGFRPNRMPAMRQLVLNRPKVPVADMENAQRQAIGGALRDALAKVRALNLPMK